jgi:hypothetical protein
MPLPTGVAEKIRSHKFGRRRLKTDSAWNAYNRVAKNEPLEGRTEGRYTRVLGLIQASTIVQGHVTAMNDALATICTQFGFVPSSDQKIRLALPDEMFIPRSVWMGYVDLATGSLTEAQRTAFEAAEKVYADHAGLLRAAIARIMAVDRALNDASNSSDRPNPGGEVGEE